MNNSDLIVEELETVTGSSETDTMKSDEKRFSVSYGMFKDFTTRSEKNQHFAVVGNYVKKQHKSSNDPLKKKAFGNYFYDLNFGSILKSRYVIEIATPALKKIKDVQNINILSDVSLQIGEIVKEAIGGVIGEMRRISESTKGKKQAAGIQEGSDYIMIKMEELTELKAASPQADLNDSSTDEDKDKFRALGVLFSRYYGNLMNTPQEILDKAKKTAGIKKKTTDQVEKDFEEMVINDASDPRILDYLMEGLVDPSSDDTTKAKEAFDSFKTADKKVKKKMSAAYFKLIGSLHYHIQTKFKLFDSSHIDKIAALYPAEEGDNLFLMVARQIEEYINVEPHLDTKNITDTKSFKEFLKKTVEFEKTSGDEKTKEDDKDQKNRWRKRYREFEFVAKQPEGQVGVDSVKDFYNKSLRLYKNGNRKEANDELDKIKVDEELGEGSWAVIKKSIAIGRAEDLEAKWKVYKDLAGEPKPKEFENLKGQIFNDDGLKNFYDAYDGNPDYDLHIRQPGFDKTINKLDSAIKDLGKKAPAKKKSGTDKEITHGELDIVQKMKKKLGIEIPTWMKKRFKQQFADKTEKQIKAIEDVIKKIGMFKQLEWRDFENLTERALRDLRMQEQLTKKLAPYLMERIKNRKPIDNRLINMIKPRKSQKGKSK